MGLLSKHSLTVTRFGAGSYVGRIWAPGASSTFTAKGNMQPMRGRELLTVPEGQRDQARWKFFTKAELRAADDGAQTAADRTTWKGRQLVVVKVEDWSEHGPRGYFRVELVEDETGGQQ